MAQNMSQTDAILKDASNDVARFFHRFHVGELLKMCNAYKQKGYSVIQIFAYLVLLMFQPLSTYMAMKVNAFKEPFSKNTILRLCNDARINWHKFLRLLSQKVISEFMRPTTSENRTEYFIVDDTPLQKSGKQTELVCKFYNHCEHRFEFGYRILSLIWSDGYSKVPIDFAPLSSQDPDLRVCEPKQCDKRTLAARIREEACMSGPDMTLLMLQRAISDGHSAKYVLFDSWFGTPKTIIRIKRELGLDVISRVKNNKNIYYEYDGQQLNASKIYSMLPKRRGRSKYLLTVDVNLLKKDENGNVIDRVPARLVYVRNKAKRRQWIIFISTDMTLTPEEIIQHYGARWGEETYFNTCKQYLKFNKECQSTSFDALTCHLAIVNVRCILLSVLQREETDHRTSGEIFYYIYNEVQEITFEQSLDMIFITLFTAIQKVLNLTKMAMDQLVKCFVNSLPKNIGNLLEESARSVATV